MDRYPYILGCLLGTAAGDAVGLVREGLTRRRSLRMYGGEPLAAKLAMGYGFCSDDTEHAQMTARAFAISEGDPEQFMRELAKQLRRWLLTCPAGVGLATLRACLKLLVGVSPEKSGVFSAGNGPAMRSPIIGVLASSEQEMRELVKRCTRVTHTDPKAYEGALLVAQAASLTASGSTMTPIHFIDQSLNQTTGEELREELKHVAKGLRARLKPESFAEERGWQRGISGYINHTVPAAIYCWASSPHDFRKCVENAVLLGGDADTVGAIAGAICGANLGHASIPEDWLSRIALWPRDRHWHSALAKSCAESDAYVPGMRWLATIPRNLLFAAIVITVGARRLLPPY